MENTKTYLILLSIIFLIGGLIGGYYYGMASGKEQGREALLVEQELLAQQAIEELKEAANPFSEEDQTVNPFKQDYENPFSQ
ncbi:hypothetical protein ACFLZC_02415 [Patescibacteria group bacterium]